MADMATAQSPREHLSVPTARRRFPFVLASVLTVVNIGVALAGIFVVDEKRDSWSDPLGKLIWLVFAQALANGLVLAPWRPTRQVGLGILVGMVLTAATGLLLVFWFAVPQSQ